VEINESILSQKFLFEAKDASISRLCRLFKKFLEERVVNIIFFECNPARWFTKWFVRLCCGSQSGSQSGSERRRVALHHQPIGYLYMRFKGCVLTTANQPSIVLGWFECRIKARCSTLASCLIFWSISDSLRLSKLYNWPRRWAQFHRNSQARGWPRSRLSCLEPSSLFRVWKCRSILRHHRELLEK